MPVLNSERVGMSETHYIGLDVSARRIRSQAAGSVFSSRTNEGRQSLLFARRYAGKQIHVASGIFLIGREPW